MREESMVRDLSPLQPANLAHILDVSQVMVCDLAGVIQWWSRGLEDLYGWPAQDAVGRISQELLETEFPVSLDAILAEVLEKGSWTGELKHCVRSGEAIWVASHWRLQQSPDGLSTLIVKTNNDITRRKQIEQELAKSEHRFRGFVESSPLPVGEVRYGGQVLRANNAYLDLLGITREEFEIHGLSLDEVTPPEWHEATERSVKESFQTRRPILYEKEYLRRDGTRVPIAVGLCWSEVASDQALAFILDLTELKRVEKALRQSEQRFRLVVESAPSGMLMVDAQRLIVLVNTQIERMFQYSREELVGRSIDFLLPERYRSQHVRLQQCFFERPTSRRMDTGRELLARRKDGSEFPVEVGLNPIETTEGLMVLSSIVDITDRNLAEQALRESEHRFRTVVESIPGIVFTNDSEGRYNFTNAQFRIYTGLPAERLLGEGWLDILHPDDREAATSICAASLVSGREYEVEYRFRRYDGVYRWHLGRCVPIRKTEGQVIGWFGTCTDIEDQKRIANDLEALVRKRTSALEAALAEKTVLLKEVHHRVKNNLAIISSLLQMEARKTNNSGARQGFEGSQRRIQAMARVHEHLYSSQQLDQVNFAEYIRQLAEELYASMVAGPVQVKLRIEAEQIQLGVDRAIPCGLILNELISNAFKYAFPAGRAGTVLVKLCRTGENRLALIVHDDGIGIPDHVEWRRTPTLGLRIVQVLTKQLEGSIEMRRESGTQFQLMFPFHQEADGIAQQCKSVGAGPI